MRGEGAFGCCLLAKRLEAAEEEVLGGCLTEILGVFLASWSLEKERTEKGVSAGELEVSFLLILIHILLILFSFWFALHCSSICVGSCILNFVDFRIVFILYCC